MRERGCMVTICPTCMSRHLKSPREGKRETQYVVKMPIRKPEAKTKKRADAQNGFCTS